MKLKRILPLMLISLFLTSCASPYLGRFVNTNYKGVCNFQNFPASCSVSDKNLSIEYQIAETGKVGEYQLTGTAENVMGGNFDRYYDQTFNILLVHNKTVIDTFLFGGSTNKTTTTFDRTFVTPYEFEASLIDYNFTYK